MPSLPPGAALNAFSLPRVALFGAAPDTPNMGVSALHASIVNSLSRALGGVEFVVFDNGLGAPRTIDASPYVEGTTLVRHGARVGRRVYLHENLYGMAFAAKLRGAGHHLNRAVRLIDSCDAVLDISGGDSFSDIYGRERFNMTYLPKAIAIARKKPLLLLPQTYGPFSTKAVREMASRVVRGASMAWARDSHSFANMQELLGDRYEPGRHGSGVDMAFALPARDPGTKLNNRIREWIGKRRDDRPVVGFNVSGLIYNDAAKATRDYGLRADYPRAVVRFLVRLLAETNAQVLLIPHVMDCPGHYESDLAACEAVSRALRKDADRVAVAPATLDHSEVKWLISKVDWFCGTRMHSTIAALSSAVPAAAIAYSDKTRGVFETGGQADHVFDPRSLDTEDICNGLMRSFRLRHLSAQQLLANQPSMAARILRQTDSFAEFVRRHSIRTRPLKAFAGAVAATSSKP